MTSESFSIVKMQEIAQKKILGDINAVQEYLEGEQKKGRSPSNALQQFVRKVQGLTPYETNQNKNHRGN